MVCSRYPKEYRYYETILKKKCFRKLRYNVWEKKTKWILLKKADLHYREKLLKKSIHLWVSYLNESYRKKINRRAAEVFYQEKLKLRGILELRKNVEQTWMLMRICKNKFEWNLKFKCWHQWKHYVEKRLKVKEVKLLANRIRKERLRTRFFYLWLFRFNEKRSLQKAYETAVTKHETKLKEKYFKTLKIFTSTQICKAKIRKLAITYYEDKLKEEFFRCWKRHTSQKKRYRLQMNIIHNFYENFLLKNYLSKWQDVYKTLKRERKIFSYNSAVNFYEKRLLGKTFKAFYELHEKKIQEKEKIEQFRIIYIKTYLNLWIEKTTEKTIWNNLETAATKWREGYLLEFYLTKFYNRYQKKVEEREEMESVIKYSNTIIIHKAFRGWYEIMERKIRIKLEFEKASKFYSEKLIKNSFSKWKKYLVRKSRKKMAAGYNQFILLSRVMEQWKIFFRERKLRLAEVKNLEQKQNTRLMKKIFDFWKTEAIVSTSKLNAAIEFRNTSRLSKTFSAWKKNTRRKTAIKNRINRNKTILNDTIIKSSINLWYEMLSIKKTLNKKVEEIRVKQSKRCLRTSYQTWQNFVGKMKNIRRNVDVYPQIRSNILIEVYLSFLLAAVNTKRDLKMKEMSAEKAMENLLKRKYLKKWLSFICWKKEKLLKCLSEEGEIAYKENVELFIPSSRNSRRQPMIPNYLKGDFGQLEDLNQRHKRKLKERRCNLLEET